MIIVKQRKPQAPEKIYTLQCKCGTIVSFKYSEGTSHRDTEGAEFLTLPCPVCHEVNRINVDRGTNRIVIPEMRIWPKQE